MKILKSLPTDKGFFDTYAPLIRAVVLAGFFAQIVSGMTESGAIFTSTQKSLAPFHLGGWEIVAAGFVAALATLVIEVGLRKTFPVAVDAILYRRWSGLDLWMSVFCWLLTIALGTTSALLSFHNSKVIVDDLTPEAEQLTTTAADSAYQASTAELKEIFSQDSAMIAANYQSQLEATETAYQAQIKAKRRQYSTVRAKERSTGQSYATEKRRIRAEIAEIEAEQAAALAQLTTGQANELRALQKALRTGQATAATDHKAAASEVTAANDQAETDRATLVSSYGGGLGWFTVVCLFLFAVSVVLDRIHRKGAGISESVQIEAYDFRPGIVREWWGAIRERISFKLHSRIAAYANNTPAAPLPSQPGAVYDLAQALQHVTIKLELDKGEADEESPLTIAAKLPPRQIGYKRYDDDGEAPPDDDPHRRGWKTDPNDTDNSRALYSTRKKERTHEPGTPNAHTKRTHETPDLRQAKQRLKMYKKRVGEHEQKAISQKRKTGKVSKRTADAIANNKEKVSHYENLIKKLS